MMWGADYPHPDGVWPDSRQIIRDTMGGLEAGLLSKIVCDNAVDRYRIGSVSNIRTLLQSVASIGTMEAIAFSVRRQNGGAASSAFHLVKRYRNKDTIDGKIAGG